MTARFLESLRGSRTRGAMPLIAEIKARSPGAGELLGQRTVEEVARRYEAAGAACLSVVTGRWYGGEVGMLVRAARVVSLPILRKDFIVSRPAVSASKDLGASAVLLTRRLLRPRELVSLCEYTLSVGLTPFVEVADAGEIHGLRLSDGVVIAVNNRDIRVKETDDGGVEKSLGLLDAAKASGAGAVVSASGIRSAAEAGQLLAAGFDGVLVGTFLLRSNDLDGILETFRVALTMAEPRARRSGGGS